MTKQTQRQLAPSRLSVPAKDGDDNADAFYLTPTHLPVSQPSTATTPGAQPQRELQALLERTTSPKKRANIERVWTALEDMRARKEQDFSLARVAEAIARLGHPGPKYQSMRNKEGADFRALIDAYRQTHGRAPAAQENDDGDEDLPLAIADPRLQHRVRVLLRQVRSLEDRNRILHDQVVRLSTPTSPTPSATAHATPADASAFSADEIEAVQVFLERLESRGFRVDDATGCILDRRSGKEVAPPYFLDALRRMVPNHSAFRVDESK